MDIQSTLEHLGLTAHEATVYLRLLQEGPATIGRLAQSTGLFRPTLYRLLPRLEQCGLVSLVPHGKQHHYAAEDPSKLENLVDDTLEDLRSLLPKLSDQFHSLRKRPVIRFYEGKSGVLAVLDDVVRSLKRGDVYYRYTSAKDYETMLRYLPKEYRSLRDAKQLQRFVIAGAGIRQPKPKLNRSYKTVPRSASSFDYDVNQVIYGNKVAYIDYSSLSALIIESSAIADLQRQVFLLLYRTL